MVGAFITMLAGIRIIKGMGKEVLNKLKGNPIDKGIELAGYGYDSVQDIYFILTQMHGKEI